MPRVRNPKKVEQVRQAGHCTVAPLTPFPSSADCTLMFWPTLLRSSYTFSLEISLWWATLKLRKKISSVIILKAMRYSLPNKWVNVRSYVDSTVFASRRDAFGILCPCSGRTKRTQPEYVVLFHIPFRSHSHLLLNLSFLLCVQDRDIFQNSNLYNVDSETLVVPLPLRTLWLHFYMISLLLKRFRD